MPSCFIDDGMRVVLCRRGIIHRDLKPENLLLTDDSQESAVKVCVRVCGCVHVCMCMRECVGGSESLRGFWGSSCCTDAAPVVRFVMAGAPYF